MTSIKAFLLASLVALAGPAFAQNSLPLLGAGGPTAVVSYTGPGDITTFTGWWGIRGYSAAFSTGSNNAIQITCASGSSSGSQFNIVILSSGNLDQATASSDCGTDATGTGSISGTTLTFTGGTIGDQVTGAGVTAGTYIVSGSSPTWTVNNSQSVGSETLTLNAGLAISEMYDQTGNGRPTLQATAGTRPFLLVNCLNGATLPCIVSHSGGLSRLQSSGNFTPATGVWSGSVYAAQVTSGSSVTLLAQDGFNNEIIYNGSNEATLVGSGANFSSAALTVGVLHAINAVTNGSSSVINTDGTEVTGTQTGKTTAGVITTGCLTGVCTEYGFADNVAWSSGTRTSLQTNQAAYW